MKTADELVKNKTHAWCPKCIEATKKANAKHNKYNYWPQPLRNFSELHADASGKMICNYHGNSEFDPNHDCEMNDCG